MNNAIKNVLLLTGGVAIGGGAGYLITKKMLEARFEADLNEQIAEVKEYYKLLRKEGEYSQLIKPTEESVIQPKYEDVISEYSGEESEEEEAVMVEPDSDEEERDPNEPYVISVDEYMNDRENYDKNTVTYFEVDDVLVDEREQVIPDVENTVGIDSLTKFGHNSNDKNVVYVRNERIEADFEVLLDTRSYSETVLGIREDKELRRMRGEDE